jgi:hypothetical protein
MKALILVGGYGKSLFMPRTARDPLRADAARWSPQHDSLQVPA